MGEENGVTIGYKEIYKELRGVSESLTKLDSRMERIEEKFGTVKDADELDNIKGRAGRYRRIKR